MVMLSSNASTHPEDISRTPTAFPEHHSSSSFAYHENVRSGAELPSPPTHYQCRIRHVRVGLPRAEHSRVGRRIRLFKRWRRSPVSPPTAYDQVILSRLARPLSLGELRWQQRKYAHLDAPITPRRAVSALGANSLGYRPHDECRAVCHSCSLLISSSSS